MKLQKLFLIAALFVLAAPLPALADIILPNLPPGSVYQLAFVTRKRPPHPYLTAVVS